jgi:predicted HTH transcriptional regulator
MKKCLKVCRDMNVVCPVQECRHWISYPDDHNCVLEAVEKNGPMTLRECSKRLGISFIRVKQIQDITYKKIKNLLDEDAI